MNLKIGALIGGSMLASLCMANTSSLTPINLTASGGYQCFIRVDFTGIDPSTKSCTGENCMVNCNAQSCIVIAGQPSTSPTPITCSMTVNNDTFTHSTNGSNSSTQPSGVSDTIVTDSQAQKICPSGFSTCAYWHSSSS